MIPEDFLSGRTLHIVTQHGKEKVLRPILRNAFGSRIEVIHANTDGLGTFSGEIPRINDPINTLRLKCGLADPLLAEVVIATEGSFGPHPQIPFLPVHEEWIMLIDRTYGLEISTREISTETNHAARKVNTQEEAQDFLNRVQFPSHGVIIRPSADDLTGMVKGITNPDVLTDLLEHGLRVYGSMHLETDMRACFNPMRMRVIEKGAHKLVEKIKSRCPGCKRPGFGVIAAEKGLPCRICQYPTNEILYLLKQCDHCGHAEREIFPQGRSEGDPMFCDQCNP